MRRFVLFVSLCLSSVFLGTPPLNAQANQAEIDQLLQFINANTIRQGDWDTNCVTSVSSDLQSISQSCDNFMGDPIQGTQSARVADLVPSGQWAGNDSNYQVRFDCKHKLACVSHSSPRMKDLKKYRSSTPGDLFQFDGFRPDENQIVAVQKALERIIALLQGESAPEAAQQATGLAASSGDELLRLIRASVSALHAQGPSRDEASAFAGNVTNEWVKGWVMQCNGQDAGPKGPSLLNSDANNSAGCARLAAAYAKVGHTEKQLTALLLGCWWDTQSAYNESAGNCVTLADTLIDKGNNNAAASILVYGPGCHSHNAAGDPINLCFAYALRRNLLNANGLRIAALDAYKQELDPTAARYLVSIGDNADVAAADAAAQQRSMNSRQATQDARADAADARAAAIQRDEANHAAIMNTLSQMQGGGRSGGSNGSGGAGGSSGGVPNGGGSGAGSYSNGSAASSGWHYVNSANQCISYRKRPEGGWAVFNTCNRLISVTVLSPQGMVFTGISGMGMLPVGPWPDNAYQPMRWFACEEQAMPFVTDNNNVAGPHNYTLTYDTASFQCATGN